MPKQPTIADYLAQLDPPHNQGEMRTAELLRDYQQRIAELDALIFDAVADAPRLDSLQNERRALLAVAESVGMIAIANRAPPE
jgi:hypothetical protein